MDQHVQDQAAKDLGNAAGELKTGQRVVEDALEEMGQLFPADYFDIQMFGSRDGIVWDAQVGLATEAQHFREDSLTELMIRLRQYHKEQS